MISCRSDFFFCSIESVIYDRLPELVRNLWYFITLLRRISTLRAL
jgi:hypothetical protein